MSAASLFRKIPCSNKEGRAAKYSLAHKLMCRFKAQKALTLCYDNSQRGLTLQHQHGKHPSAFFKGMHQCAHKIEPFEDTRFDALSATFTQIDQAVPSPLGMSAFKIVDTDMLGQFFLKYRGFKSMTLPNFMGRCVRAYGE